MADEFEKCREYNRANVDRSREMRKNPTSVEDKMGKEILRDRPGGYKFTRQKPMGGFILDFYCAKLSLAIELDGEIHNKTKEYDTQRSIFLSEQGINIIRYWNEEIMKNTEAVYKDLLAFMKEIENTLKSPC